jgi:hypothetical protein
MRAQSWFDCDPASMAVLFFGIAAVAALAQFI